MMIKIIPNKIPMFVLVFVFSFFGLLLLSCTPHLVIKSEPSEAEIYLKVQNSEDKKSLGKTPLDLSSKDLENVLKTSSSSEEYFELIAEKKEYESQKILVPLFKMGSLSSTIGLKLNKPGAGAAFQEETKASISLLQILHNAQKFANAAQFERALIEIDKILDKDPNIVRAISLKGSILFVQSKYNESLQYFEKALKIDPGFEEAAKMIIEIKKKGSIGSASTMTSEGVK